MKKAPLHNCGEAVAFLLRKISFAYFFAGADLYALLSPAITSLVMS